MTTLDSFSQLIFNVYEAFTVALFARKRDRLACLSSVTFAGSFDRNRTLPLEGSLPGWAIRHNEPLIIPNFDKDEAVLGYYGGKEDIKSFMAYPVSSDSVIVVDSKKKYVFTDKEKKILGSFAAMIREEMEKEKTAREAEEALDELRTEKRIVGLFAALNAAKISPGDIMKEVLSLSGADFAFVCTERSGRLIIYDTFGSAGDEFVKKECTPGGSIASMVMEGGGELLLPHNSGYLREKPLFFPGETIKARQFFGFPLMTEDVIVGVMGFGSASGKSLKEGAIGLLRNISALMSLHYAYLWMRDHLEKVKEFEPVTGAVQFSTFLGIMEKMITKGDGFHLLSVKLPRLHVYNRKMGYEAANALLTQTATIIRYCAGAGSFVTRKGGGHFYALVRNGDAGEMRNLVKVAGHAIRKSLSPDKVGEGDGAVKSGFSSFPEDGRDLWTLIEKSESKQ